MPIQHRVARGAQVVVQPVRELPAQLLDVAAGIEVVLEVGRNLDGAGIRWLRIDPRLAGPGRLSNPA